jgi:rhodanese-related sulfurtransferase
MNIFDALLKQRDNINNVNPETFTKMMHEEPEPVILDVRTMDEYSTFKIPKSILIDFYNSNFGKKLDELDRSKTYLVYCASGSRSLAACKQMNKLGFEKVYNLQKGILSWRGEIEQGRK